MKSFEEFLFWFVAAGLLFAVLFGTASCQVHFCKQKYVGASTLGCLLAH